MLAEERHSVEGLFQHPRMLTISSSVLVYIAAVKRIGFLLLIVLVALPSLANDEQSIIVTSSSIVKNHILVKADWQGKATELICSTIIPSCVEPKPGKYQMVPISGLDGVYEDCTSVVLYGTSGDAKERIGVYCWLGDPDCYMVSCTPVHVDTLPMEVLAQQTAKGHAALIELSPARLSAVSPAGKHQWRSLSGCYDPSRWKNGSGS
jgi:hypothetical protein